MFGTSSDYLKKATPIYTRAAHVHPQPFPHCKQDPKPELSAPAQICHLFWSRSSYPCGGGVLPPVLPVEATAPVAALSEPHASTGGSP